LDLGSVFLLRRRLWLKFFHGRSKWPKIGISGRKKFINSCIGFQGHKSLSVL
jgi:hypothetical protein